MIYRVRLILPVSCKFVNRSATLIHECSEIKLLTCHKASSVYVSLSLLCIRVTEPPLQNQPDFCKVYCLITDKLIWLVRIFSFNSWKYEQWNSSITLEKGQPIKSSFSRLNAKVQSLFCVMFVVHRFLPSVDKLCTEKAEVCSISPFAMILPKSWLWYFRPGYTNKEGFCARNTHKGQGFISVCFSAYY